MTFDAQSKYLDTIETAGGSYSIYNIQKVAKDLGFDLKKLPYSLRVLLENVVRSGNISESAEHFSDWAKNKTSKGEMNYFPARVLMQDFTGVPAIVDLASMRDAMKKLGKDPLKINPMIPVDLVIDHSVQVDSYGNDSSFEKNVEKEMERNGERYKFLKWGKESFQNFQVVPPGTGICHQVNLEYLGKIVQMKEKGEKKYLYPDTLVGTDSHTTMINALSILGWGVGGIEAEAAMLGQALPMLLPDVVGVKLTGKIEGNITATDLVLSITEKLRQKGVVGKFVEFFGPGLDSLNLADRATISNMAPEYGATCGFFPVDAETIKYLHLTARSKDQVQIVEDYTKAQGLWRDDVFPEYSDVLELDISTVEPSLAGPKRPQDRVSLSDMQNNFASNLPAMTKNDADILKKNPVDSCYYSIGHGDVVIAAITSCTNTSNPSVMVAAGLVAKKAAELGVSVKPWVKTSLAPGSKVVTDYLDKGGLTEYLDQLGFNLVGYGCTTCIGNSGPLNKEIEDVIKKEDLVAASVLSGNRNFEGRVHPHVKANYLASPPLVVAYAIAGTLNIDLDKDAIAKDSSGKDVYLKDLWPSSEEISIYVDSCVSPEMFSSKYADVFEGDDTWKNIEVSKSDTYDWQESTYINNPPYFENIEKSASDINDIKGARVLALFGDSITTDHISPAGTISMGTPAAEFLLSKNVQQHEFNSYGARRGNHEVMMRGTFANVRVKNLMCKGTEGGFTINKFTGKQSSIYDAAMDYKARAVPLVVMAGAEYGTGSSRDWAAKGTMLLGVKAVLAESFERIHRSNLIGMGVLPITFDNMKLKELELVGDEEINIVGISENMQPYQKLQCEIKRNDGKIDAIDVTLQLYTLNELEFIRYGRIMGAVVKNMD